VNLTAMPAFLLLRRQALILLLLLLPNVVLVFRLILYSIDQGQDFFDS
jgi:cytochrome c-type biogenesis protein CcmE